MFARNVCALPLRTQHAEASPDGFPRQSLGAVFGILGALAAERRFRLGNPGARSHRLFREERREEQSGILGALVCGFSQTGLWVTEFSTAILGRKERDFSAF
jgi:hypothetical protein